VGYAGNSGVRSCSLWGALEQLAAWSWFLESQKIIIFLERLDLSQRLLSLSLWCFLGVGLRNPPVRLGVRDLSLGLGMEPSDLKTKEKSIPGV